MGANSNYANDKRKRSGTAMRDPREELAPGEPGLRENPNNAGLQPISKTPGLTPEPKWRETFPNKAGAQWDRPQAGTTSGPTAPRPPASTAMVAGQPVAQPPKTPPPAATSPGTTSLTPGETLAMEKFFAPQKFSISTGVLPNPEVAAFDRMVGAPSVVPPHPAPAAPAPRPVRQAARSTEEALSMTHPGFDKMTPAQKAAALRSRPATSNVGQVINTGRSAPNMRGERTLQTTAGPVIEVNPREDARQNFIPAGDPLLPANAARGMIVDKQYRPADGNAVASVSYGPTPTARTGRIFDETGDRTVEFIPRDLDARMASLAAERSAKAKAAAVEAMRQKYPNPKLKARSADPVGPINQRSSGWVGATRPEAPPQPAPRRQTAFERAHPPRPKDNIPGNTVIPNNQKLRTKGVVDAIVKGNLSEAAAHLNRTDVAATQAIARTVHDHTRGSGFEGSPGDRWLTNLAGGAEALRSRRKSLEEEYPGWNNMTPDQRVAAINGTPVPQEAKSAASQDAEDRYMLKGKYAPKTAPRVAKQDNRSAFEKRWEPDWHVNGRATNPAAKLLAEWDAAGLKPIPRKKATPLSKNGSQAQVRYAGSAY